MLMLNDGRSELWQWDTGRTLAVDADCSQVHFSNKVFGRSIDVDVVDGAAIIPDILLQTDKDLNVWAFVGAAENGYTKISKTFKVNRRNKPADYVFTQTDQMTLSELSGRLDRIEESQNPDAIKNAVDDYLKQNPVEAPVQSVNGLTGTVELNAEDVGAIAKTELPTAINTALAQAKASGEFDGKPGDNGVTFTPSVSENGDLSWRNNGGLPNPQTVNIRGTQGDSTAATAAANAAKTSAENAETHAADAAASAAAAQATVGAMGTELSQIKSDIGNLDDLNTTAKKNLVAAVNEALKNGGGTVDDETIKRLVQDYLAANPPAVTETDPTVPAWAMQPQKPTYTASEVGALPDTYTPPNQTAQQVGADPAGTAATAVSQHNTDTAAHNDLRLALQGLANRVNAVLDSDDTTLDQMSEVVAYIKSNKTLIDAITTSKVSVTDIVNDLITNASDKPLSAAQGVAIKTLIDGLRNDKLDAAELTNAVNTALAQAKASGEFDGAPGSDGKSAYAYAKEGGYTGTEVEFAEKLAQTQLVGTTGQLTPMQVYNAVSAGIPVKVQYLDDTYGLLSYTNFNVAESMNVIAANSIVYFNGTYILAELWGGTDTNNWYFMATTLAEKQDIPTKLSNPNALTFTGAVTGAYDGSSAVTISIPVSSGETISEYARTEAETVARIVNQHQSNDSIVFPFLSDAHCGYYNDADNEAAKLAGQLLNQIGKRVPYDFIVHGGDFSTGAWNTTKQLSFEQIEDYTELTSEADKGVPSIWCAGNHDDAPYQATAGRVTQKELFGLVGRKNRMSGAVCPNGCNYGYLDLENRKLRVIYLDTDDKRSWGTVAVGNGATAPAYLNAHNVSGNQLKWLADTALDFTGKGNPAEWGIVVVSHVALNISGTITDAVSGETYAHSTANAAMILNAYRTGKSGSITHNGITVNYNFTTVESKATVICAVHGHNHKFGSETLTGGILSIGCPNVMNGRERASDDGNTYTKTAGTADGTSFCILTIDLGNCVIYADCVGAGYDREFTYTTEVIAYTNQIPISTDADGNVYNGVGYASGQRLNSSGAADGYNGSYLTGFIPVKIGDVVRLKNVKWQNGATTGLNSGNQRISFYSADKAHLAQTNAIGLGGTLSGVKDANGIWTQFTAKNWSGGNITNAAFFRLNCAGITAESVITVNEEIAEA